LKHGPSNEHEIERECMQRCHGNRNWVLMNQTRGTLESRRLEDC